MLRNLHVGCRPGIAHLLVQEARRLLCSLALELLKEVGFYMPEQEAYATVKMAC